MTTSMEEIQEAIRNSVPLAQQGGVSIVIIPTDQLATFQAALQRLEQLAAGGSVDSGGDSTVPGVPPPPKIPASRAGRLSTTDDTKYQDVASWELSDVLRGELAEVTFTSDKPANALFQLVIAGKEQWTDRLFLNALTVNVAGLPNDLPPNSSIVLRAKTNNSAEAIVVDAEISGTEQLVT